MATGTIKGDGIIKKSLAITFINYGALIYATDLGIDDCTKYAWLIYALGNQWNDHPYVVTLDASVIGIKSRLMLNSANSTVSLKTGGTTLNVLVIGIPIPS